MIKIFLDISLPQTIRAISFGAFTISESLESFLLPLICTPLQSLKAPVSKANTFLSSDGYPEFDSLLPISEESGTPAAPSFFTKGDL